MTLLSTVHHIWRKIFNKYLFGFFIMRNLCVIGIWSKAPPKRQKVQNIATLKRFIMDLKRVC